MCVGYLYRAREGVRVPFMGKLAGVQQTPALSTADQKAVSKAFAEAALGLVYVLRGKAVRKDSVWVTDEKPALTADGKV
ncbi:hypothetical protein DXG01_001887 [Tephrocybe rancida]|nr:hypothetical protein DXG01_001887 [Tephrocybe rancida]